MLLLDEGKGIIIIMPIATNQHCFVATVSQFSQRDVPGTTKSIKKWNNIEAIMVGVNIASMPPAVPSVFTISGESNQSIIGMHGYGDSHVRHSLIIVPGLPEALVFAIRGDNSRPPSVVEVFRNYAVLNFKKMFP